MLRINIFGDLCLHGFDVAPVLSDGIVSDMVGAYNLVNLECPITNAVVKRPLQAKNLRVAQNSKSLAFVKKFDAVSLGNNHIRDYLDAGCEDTVAFLRKNGVDYFGIGRSQDEALRPLQFCRGGVRVAVVGATRYANSNGCAWGTASDAGRPLLRMINLCKIDGRFTIVYLHAGYEYVDLPAPRERKIARDCIDAGADLVVMSHPHVYQGYETYKDKFVFYSLGNFCFHKSIMDEVAARRGDPRLMLSFYLSISINKDGQYSVDKRGYRIVGDQISALQVVDHEMMLSHVEQISLPLRGRYYSYWRMYYRQAVLTCRQNKKIRENFQKLSERRLIDRIRILLDFNSQDLRNRLANLVPWFFS